MHNSHDRSAESITIIPVAVFTPREVAKAAKVSPGFVRKQIREGKLPAYKFGEKLLRIKGVDAEQWITKFLATGSGGSHEHQDNSPEDNGAPSGGQKRSAADTAFASVLSETKQ